MAFLTKKEISDSLYGKGVTRIFKARDPYNRMLAESANEDLNFKQRFDIFLSHSYNDAKLIYEIKQFLQKLGFSVYVDWVEDYQLSREKVNKATAKIIKRRMNSSSSIIYVPSPNSTHSVWMPWELGYMDALTSKAAILPILTNKDEKWQGHEFLNLYPKIENKNNMLVVMKEPQTLLKQWVGNH